MNMLLKDLDVSQSILDKLWANQLSRVMPLSTIRGANEMVRYTLFNDESDLLESYNLQDRVA
jgi:hypothetical protein